MSYLERDKLVKENKALKEQISDWANTLEMTDSYDNDVLYQLQEIAKDMREASK